MISLQEPNLRIKLILRSKRTNQSLNAQNEIENIYILKNKNKFTVYQN